MSEPEREAFVARFTEESQGIGFAVLGGAFGEGIDLPGQRLIGAFIATLGLPQVNPVNEHLRAAAADAFRRGLRLRLPVSRPAEGGAGGGPRDPRTGATTAWWC
jgi:DNA excision repair protein ERCC-2